MKKDFESSHEKKNHSKVKFVTVTVLERIKWNNMLFQFMKGKSHVMQCDICDYSCFQKGNMKKGSVHEMKKAFVWVAMIIPYYRNIVFPFISHYRRHFLSKMIMIISQIYTYLLNYYRRLDSCFFFEARFSWLFSAHKIVQTLEVWMNAQSRNN